MLETFTYSRFGLSQEYPQMLQFLGIEVPTTGSLHRLSPVAHVEGRTLSPSKFEQVSEGLDGSSGVAEPWRTGNKRRAARTASNVILRLERAKDEERRDIFRTSNRLYPATLLSALDEKISKQQIESALKIFELLRRQEWYKTESQTFVKLMVMFGKCKRPDLAEVLILKMVEDDCPPTVELYTALVSVYTSCNLLDKAFAIYEDMKQRVCGPDAWTYSLLIQACCESGMFDRAQELLREMGIFGIRPNTVTYNTIINEYGKLGLFVQMERMFEDMGKMLDCQPDIWTWNSILKAYGKRGRIQQMELWFDKLSVASLEPDVVTLNTMVKSYGRYGQFAKMTAVVAYMSRYMFPVDVVTYNIMIDAYGKAGHITQMEDTFKQMKLKGLKPNCVTYCSLISVYGKLADGFERVEKIFRQIRNSDVILDVALYNSLIDAYQRFGDLVAMKEIFQEMKRNRCWPDSLTYSVMIQAYKRNKMYNIADELQRDMELHRKRDVHFTVMAATVVPDR